MPRIGWRERKSAFPSLAGQDAGYLAGALAAYKQGTRKDETMKGLAASLDDAAMKNLAAFFTEFRSRNSPMFASL